MDESADRQLPKGGSRVVRQTLPTYFPQSKPKCMLPSFFIVGIILIILGSVILRASDSVVEVLFRYEGQNNYQYTPAAVSVGMPSIQHGLRKFTVNGTDHIQGSKARVVFTLRKPLLPPIYLYYGLSKFYQNYLDYHDGRSSLQLAGQPVDNSLRYKCEPYLTPGSVDGRSATSIEVQGQPVLLSAFTYYPCGITAWSMFNDTFALYAVNGTAFNLPTSNKMPLNMSQLAMLCNGSDFTASGAPLSGQPNSCAKQGISWDADLKTRFKPIVPSARSWSQGFTLPTTDPYLLNGWYAFEPGHRLPDPMDLDFHVWMRIAATPSFRKLYRIINVPMPIGSYLMDIDEFYPARPRAGRAG